MNILFLCTGNSCRSQMAEAWTRHLLGDSIHAVSAGTEPQGLNQRAVQVMREAGVSMDGHHSKAVEALDLQALDLVITVCGDAQEQCPVFPAQCRVVHVGFEDPPRLAAERAAAGEDEQAQLDCYRRVRDEIRAFVDQLPAWLEKHA